MREFRFGRATRMMTKVPRRMESVETMREIRRHWEFRLCSAFTVFSMLSTSVLPLAQAAQLRQRQRERARSRDAMSADYGSAVPITSPTHAATAVHTTTASNGAREARDRGGAEGASL